MLQGSIIDAVKGINLQSLIPINYHIYDKAKTGLTKNNHFREKLKKGDFLLKMYYSWYASLENLKQVRNLEWLWKTRLTPAHLINSENRPIIKLK